MTASSKRVLSRFALRSLAASLTLLSGCGNATPVTLLVAVSAPGLSDIYQLAVTVTESDGSMATRQLPASPPAIPISFPTALAAILPAAGGVSLEIFGLGSDGAKLAHGASGAVPARAGSVVNVSVALMPWLGPTADLSMPRIGDQWMPVEGDLALPPDQSLGMDGSADLSIPDFATVDLTPPPGCQVDKDCPRPDGGPVLSCCNGHCFDESADSANCGRYGAACPGGWRCCGAVCANPTNDPTNCGGCGITCPLTAGVLVTKCAANKCEVSACTMGLADCDGNSANGCEVALQTAAVNGGAPPTGAMVRNCGACGTNCTANGGQEAATVKCAGGSCAVSGCAIGYGDCDGNFGNGCEANLTTSDGQQSGAINHCGNCGTTCPLTSQASGTSCVGGGCRVMTCNAGFADCDGNFANGCEANLLTDAKNCKTCGNVCGMNQVCTNGVCVIYVGPQSCAGLPMNCGPNQSDNCCASGKVPGGTFNRSNDVNYPATVSDFRLDKYEITVGRFRQFVKAGYGTQMKPPANGAGANLMMGTGWGGANWTVALAKDTATLIGNFKCFGSLAWTDAVGNNENLPMNCINWFEAFAFCAWDGGRLPTEAEWNYAAAGGSEQRPYPWSMNMNDLVIDDSYVVYSGNAKGVAPVGSKSTMGDGKWGQSDLAGNVWEWNFDWYAPNYPKPCTDCSNLQAATYRVYRGGAYDNSEPYMDASFRNDAPPVYRGSFVGARCARTP